MESVGRHGSESALHQRWTDNSLILTISKNKIRTSFYTWLHWRTKHKDYIYGQDFTNRRLQFLRAERLIPRRVSLVLIIRDVLVCTSDDT